MSNFKVRFWGVRGSYPVPGSETVKYGGNTACIEVEIEDQTIILDAGSGIIKLGQRMLTDSFRTGKPISATILFTHMHHDHNQGFPFFKPAYLGTSRINLFGPKLFQEDIEKVLSRAMLPPFFPVELSELNSARIVHNIHDSEFIVFSKAESFRHEVFNKFRGQAKVSDDDIVIDIMKGYAHPKGGVIFYKIKHAGKTVVLATDTEGYLEGDKKLAQYSKGCDVLIHDAQYTMDEYTGAKGGPPKQGFGHSTYEMAAEVARLAGVKLLVLFHHDPEHSDDQIAAIESSCKAMFPATVSAYECMELAL